MFELKPLQRESIPTALDKAEHYRLLNEPGEAESICLDVLEVEPDNQRALVTLLLALTDQFEKGLADRPARAMELLPRLSSEYERAYYAGVICERRGKTVFRRGTHGSGSDAYEWLTEAMEWFEQAEKVRPIGNDSATLRWNACVRKLRSHKQLRPREAETAEPYLE